MLKCIFSLFIIAIPLAFYGQQQSVLSLEKCILLAEQQSFLLQANNAEIDAAENIVSIAKTNALPKIDGELATENRFLKPYSYNQTWASVYADWSLGDYLKKTDRSAIQDVETQKIAKEQIKLDLAGRITSIYMSILMAQQKVEILQTRLKFLNTHLDIVTGFWHAGVRSQLDVFQSETEIIALQEELSNLVYSDKNLRNELAPLIGLNSTDNWQLMHLAIGNIAQIPMPVLSAESVINNPLITLYDSKIKSEQFKIEETEADKMPHIKLGSSFNTDGDPTGDGNFMAINAGITIPIYYGKEFKYRKQLVENNILSLQSQQQNALQELNIKLAQSLEKLNQFKALLNIQYKKIDMAKKTADFAEINYNAGISSNLEFLSAQQNLLNSELATQETLLDYAIILIDFYMVTNQVQRIVSLGNIQ